MHGKAAISDELAAEMTPAVRVFVESLLDRIDALETQLGKTPQNSSLPPSSQHPHAKPAPKPKSSDKKPGGQPGHKRHQRALVPAERVNETATYTLFAIRLSRRAQVVRELLGEAFDGAITTDRYSGYNDYQRRQLCWAHLLRDFQALIDAGGAGKRIGLRLRDVAQELFRHWHRARDGTITRRTMCRHIHRLVTATLRVSVFGAGRVFRFQ